MSIRSLIKSESSHKLERITYSIQETAENKQQSSCSQKMPATWITQVVLQAVPAKVSLSPEFT